MTTENPYDKTVAQQYLTKAKLEPWECTANDVKHLALVLLDADWEIQEYEQKYHQTLNQSIAHGHAMLGNVMTLALERAQRLDADNRKKAKKKK